VDWELRCWDSSRRPWQEDLVEWLRVLGRPYAIDDLLGSVVAASGELKFCILMHNAPRLGRLSHLNSHMQPNRSGKELRVALCNVLLKGVNLCAHNDLLQSDLLVPEEERCLPANS